MEITISPFIYKYILTYGQADQRTLSRSYESNVLKKITWYDGAYQRDSSTGLVRQIHYISGGAGLAAIFVRTNNVDTMYYVHTDHLGSFDLITSSTGAVKDRYSFDAWGRRRNPLTWTYTNVPVNYLFNRGYTGHEHLDQFKLINMNGRVYDPLLGRFLSPDKYVQGADFTQGYNRYSYVQNNPMNRVDPSGWKMVRMKEPYRSFCPEYTRGADFATHFSIWNYNVILGPESGWTDRGAFGDDKGLNSSTAAPSCKQAVARDALIDAGMNPAVVNYLIFVKDLQVEFFWVRHSRRSDKSSEKHSKESAPMELTAALEGVGLPGNYRPDILKIGGKIPMVIGLANWIRYMRATNFRTYSGDQYHISDIIDVNTIPAKDKTFRSILENDPFGGSTKFRDYGNAIAYWLVFDKAYYSDSYSSGYITGVINSSESGRYYIKVYSDDPKAIVFTISTNNPDLYDYLKEISH